VSTHELVIESEGPPVYHARCTCAAWEVWLFAEELQRRGYETIEDVRVDVTQDHQEHADGRAAHARARPSPDFY
jgi:hypothetical protein